MIRRVMIVVAGVVSVLVLFFAVTPSTEPVVHREPSSLFDGDTAVANARAEFRARSDSAIALDRALQRAVAIEAATAARRLTGPTAFSADARLKPELRAEYARVAQAQMAALGTPKVPVRVVLLPVEENGFGYSRLTVLPTHAGEACVSVIQLHVRTVATLPAKNDRLVGACGFYARYGLPGRGVLAWMDSVYVNGFNTDEAPARVATDEDTRGEFSGYTVAMAPSVAACVAGRDAACDAAIAGPDWYRGWNPGRRTLSDVEEAGVRVLRTTSFEARWSPSRHIARLRDHVGDEAFTKIWTSDATPPVAYRQVMGEPFATFARPLLLEEVRPHRPGPLRADLPLAVSLSLGALCAAWAIRRTRRERS